jgi:UDP-N-acetylglucosamine 2-epimerase (non-hydrolysing)
MAPVILELRRRADRFDLIVVATGQHREMLNQVLEPFDIRPDIELGLMQPNQHPGNFASRAIGALTDLFRDLKPDQVLLQGDTTTVMSAALAGFYHGIVVGHVEAGLRSFDRRNPFPEEVNRKIAGCIADLHFAPTAGARENLVREGVSEARIFVTGNTIVDALRAMRTDGAFDNPLLRGVPAEGRRMLLVTAHRRENHGAPLASICEALKQIVDRFDDVEIVFPVHLNPNVQSKAREALDGIDRIHMTDPVSYRDLLGLMRRCHLILTDSGGIQEEAPSFRKPVLILREVTERPEVIHSGAGRLVGTDTRVILDHASQLLADPAVYLRMTSCANPFGDGAAARRICDVLEAPESPELCQPGWGFAQDAGHPGLLATALPRVRDVSCPA